jgi:hypothetical protein
MPRIFDSANNPFDFCRSCYPSEMEAMVRFGKAGDGPDNRGNCFAHGAEHPAYEDEDYRCWACRRYLVAGDN